MALTGGRSRAMHLDADSRRMKSRKLRILSFSCHIPVWVMAEAFDLLPEDSMIVSCHFESATQFLSTIVIWSSKFPEIPESQQITPIEVEAHDDGRVALKEFVNGVYRPCRF